MRHIGAIPASLLGLALAGCGPVTPGGAELLPLRLSFSQLVPIERRYGHYEAWARVGGQAVSLGRFDRTEDGVPVGLGGGKLPPEPVSAAATEVFVTQEPPGDADARPSKQVFLRGAIVGGEAVLRTPLTEAWREAKGVYILDNPFTWQDGTDYNGIWFGYYDRDARAYQTGLTLPEAPDGTMYAGWVILKGVPLRVGKFRTALDNDDWGVYSGRTGASELIDPVGRPMPGEDFFTNLPAGVETGPNKPNLGGATVIVSLEDATLAHEDQYPGPVRVLTATVPEAPEHMKPYAFRNVVGEQVPSGIASFQ
ncbi:MAG: hypothetical protein VKQ33_14410 [Candidatus Sericytochromatia bacterium]|nr:hypothetical protein [Candidatus Sericytochromatia bacterium]